MNARTLPPALPAEPPPPPAGDATCIAWQSRYGTILIEVVDGEVRVNGQRVEPAAPPAP